MPGYSGEQRGDTGAYGAGAYGAGAYGAEAYGTGAYRAGAYGTGAYGAGIYGTGDVYKSGYASGAAPGKISFTLGGTGYETGSSAGSGYGNFRSSAISKPYGTYRQRVSSVHHSGTKGYTGGAAPGKISFTQDFSRISGQSLGTHRSSGISGVSTARRTDTSVVRDEYPMAVSGNIGSSVNTGTFDAGEVSGINYQEVAGIGERGSGAGYRDDGVKVISAPVSPAVSRPYGTYRQRVSSVRHGGSQGYTGGAAPGKISFTQDFSRVSGQSLGARRPSVMSGVSTARRTTTPVVRDEYPGAVVGSIGSSLDTGTFDAGEVTGVDYQEVAGIGERGSGADYRYGGVKVISAPVSPAISRPFVGSAVGLKTVHKTGIHRTATHPQTVSFIQDFSRVSGQSALKPAIHSYEKINTPVRTLVAPKPSTGSAVGLRTVHKTGIHRTAIQPQTISFIQDFSKVSGQSPIKPIIPSYERMNTPARTVVVSKPSSGSSIGLRTVQKSGIHRTAIQPQSISFVQDFSKVSGQSAVSAIKPVIQSYEKIRTPVRTVVAPKVTSGSYGQSGIIRSSGFLGNTGTQPRISFTQDFSNVRGQSQQFSGKPRVQSFNRISRPVVGINRVSAPAVGAFAQHPVGHGADYLEETDVHGTTNVRGYGDVGASHGTVGSSRHSGYEGANIKPASVSSFDKLSTDGLSTLSRQSSGNRYGSGMRRGSQSFSSAGPAKISFTQDFSRISGRQTSGIKPVISSRTEIPAFSGVRTSPVAPRPNPVAPKLVFKAPKTPVVQQPTDTTVYDQSPVQGISDVAVGQIITDKFTHSTEPINTGFVREHVVDYKQEIANVGSYEGDKLVYAPRSEGMYDKSSSYGHSGLSSGISSSSGTGDVASAYKFTSADRVGDKSNAYVVVPIDEKSELIHSAGVIPTSGFAEEKGSVYGITSGNINSALSSHAGQGQMGHLSVTTPFKSYYSSSYPGYSHVSGESPRFDFSHDKSLLYTYSSPHISSPFSYTYSSGKGQYDDLYKKAAA